MIKLDDINWSPSDRQLRQFGLISLVALPFIAWLWGGSPTVIGICTTVGAVLAGIGMMAPQLIKPIFIGLTIVAIPIGMVVGELAMLIVFYGVMLPIGLMRRLLGKDPLNLEIDRSRESYWSPKSQPKDVSRYYHQS